MGSIKCETVKLLEENTEESLWDLGCGEDFLDITTKSQSIEEKNFINYTSSKI